MTSLPEIQLSKRARSRPSLHEETMDVGVSSLHGQMKAPGPVITLHRKCKLCPRYDDDDDPFELAVKGERHRMFWGYAPDINNKTSSWFCSYCKRFFDSVVKGIPVPDTGKNFTLDTYRTFISAEGRLDVHLALVLKMLENMIAKHTRKAHIDWCELQTSILEKISIMESVKKQGGFSFLKNSDYDARKGTLSQAQLETCYAWTNEEGIDGWCIPDVEVRYENIERNQAVRKTQVNTSDKCFFSNQLELQQKLIADGNKFGAIKSKGQFGVATMLGLLGADIEEAGLCFSLCEYNLLRNYLGSGGGVEWSGV